jgi:hypothetical protein
MADLSIAPHETTSKKVEEQLSDSEISGLESRKLVAQYSILVVIAGIVSWPIALLGVGLRKVALGLAHKLHTQRLCTKRVFTRLRRA